jgi:hypothetical protein
MKCLLLAFLHVRRYEALRLKTCLGTPEICCHDTSTTIIGWDDNTATPVLFPLVQQSLQMICMSIQRKFLSRVRSAARMPHSSRRPGSAIPSTSWLHGDGQLSYWLRKSLSRMLHLWSISKYSLIISGSIDRSNAWEGKSFSKIKTMFIVFLNRAAHLDE